MTRFTAFASALASLCREHGVELEARGARVAVRDLAPGDDPVADLVDATSADSAEAAGRGEAAALPPHFDTFIEARKHPGFVGEAMRRADAVELAAQHAGAQAVPIGARVRGWAVIAPTPRKKERRVQDRK